VGKKVELAFEIEKKHMVAKSKQDAKEKYAIRIAEMEKKFKSEV
jgi:hypothetical protein